MDTLVIRGGRPLRGSVAAGGAKNAVLPAMAAALLTPERVTLEGVPRVRDVATMAALLRNFGAETERDETAGTLAVAAERVFSTLAPYDLVRTMRASVLALGPLLAREGHAEVSLPGGCAIGLRPVNLHLDAMRRLGAVVHVEGGYIHARAKKLRGAEIAFETRTVTGTENVMMAASLAEGTTVIRNAAREPEIADVADLLRAMGARVEGDGGDVITVRGVASLRGARHRVLPDRIVAGTLLMAAAATRGSVRVEGARPAHLRALLARLAEAGVPLTEEPDAVSVLPDGELRAVSIVTEPFPGFATDLQAQYMALMTQARGETSVVETIFENRFMHAGELQRMGADIRIDGAKAVVRGPTPLTGAHVMATDLRASASLVLAGLAAKGETTVHRVYHLDRGYERLDEKLRALGADVERGRE